MSTTELTNKFSRNLKLLREARGFSKSELARKIWGTMTDSRGYEVARNRDRIGTWEAGKSAPAADNLLLLSRTLDVSVAELAPDLAAQHAPGANTASLAIHSVEGEPGRVVLRVNMVLPAQVAFEIARLIHSNADGVAEVA